MKLKIWIDGASRGNPGRGSIGVYVKNGRGSLVAEIARAIGHCTNNHAEYAALHEALKAARRLKADTLEIFSDSQLLVQQFNGAWKIKSPDLAEFMKKIQAEASRFKAIKLSHVRREFNKEADRLANEALDREKGKKPKRKNSSWSGYEAKKSKLPSKKKSVAKSDRLASLEERDPERPLPENAPLPPAETENPESVSASSKPPASKSKKDLKTQIEFNF